jgi:hypothetical protein
MTEFGIVRFSCPGAKEEGRKGGNFSLTAKQNV